MRSLLFPMPTNKHETGTVKGGIQLIAYHLDQSNQSRQSIARLYCAVPFANLCILYKNASPKLISCSKLASHLIFFIQNLMCSVLLELLWVVKNLIRATIALIKWIQCISHRFPNRLWTILLFTLSSIEREREINWVTGIYPTNNSTLRPTETTQVQIRDWIMMWEGLCTPCSWIAPRWEVWSIKPTFMQTLIIHFGTSYPTG